MVFVLIKYRLILVSARTVVSLSSTSFLVVDRLDDWMIGSIILVNETINVLTNQSSTTSSSTWAKQILVSVEQLNFGLAIYNNSIDASSDNNVY
jgi:hypothetical protein